MFKAHLDLKLIIPKGAFAKGTFLGLLVVIGFATSGHASANVSNVFPRPGDSYTSSDGGNQVFATAARGGTYRPNGCFMPPSPTTPPYKKVTIDLCGYATGLTADSQFKVFVMGRPSARVAVTITRACDNGRWQDPNNPDIGNAGITVTSASSGNSYNNRYNCSSSDIQFYIDPYEFNDVSATYPGYYAAVVYVTKTADARYPNGVGEKSFGIRVSPWALVSFDDAHGSDTASYAKVSMQDIRGGYNATNDPTTNYRFTFKTDCNYRGNSFYLRWSDADYNTNQQKPRMSWVLRIVDQFGNQIGGNLDSMSGPALGGPNQYVAHNVNTGGRVTGNSYLQWQWYNVDQSNGLQFWLPFSEINTKIQCPDWNLSSRSTANTGTATPTNRSVTFTHHVQNNGPSTAKYDWSIRENYIPAGQNPSPLVSLNNNRVKFQTNNTVNALGQGCPGPQSPHAAQCGAPANDVYGYTFPANAQDGDRYCQAVFYTNATGPNTPEQGSTPACVTFRSGNQLCWKFDNNLQSSSVYRFTLFHSRNFAQPAPPPDHNSFAGVGGYDYQSQNIHTENASGQYNDRVSTYFGPPGYYFIMQYPPPKGVDRLLFIENWHYDRGSNTWSYSTRTVTAIDCYKAICSINSVDGNIDGAPGQVKAGQSFTVHATVTNIGNDPKGLPGNSYYSFLSLNSGPWNGSSSPPFNNFSQQIGPLGLGQSKTLTFNLTAPAGVGAYTLWAHPAYSNLFNFGFWTDCSYNVNVYQHFSATVKATGLLTPTLENPDNFTYNTSITVSGVSVPVPIPTSSCAYMRPINPCGGVIFQQNGGGVYGPGTTNTLGPTSRSVNKPVQAGDRYCADIAAAYTDGWIGPGGVVRGTGIGASPTASSCNIVTNEPYFKVYGSGASANGDLLPPGAGATGACNGGTLAGWNDNTDKVRGDRGAGSQLSALALAKIVGFASAQTVATRSPTNLTFANSGVSITNHADSPELGGKLGGSGNCLPNIEPTTTATPKNIPNISLNGLSGSYTVNNDTSISGTLVQSQHVSIFVKGNVTIDGNITYGGGNWAPGSANTLPSFSLHATGNIIIKNGVTQLDGLYVAQPQDRTSGGIIYTCDPTTDLFSTCNQQLNVYGSFVAHQVKLLRTYGSLRDAVPGESQASGARNCSHGTTNSICAAEVFHFTPDLYLTPFEIKPTNNGAPTYDAITSLPPVL